MTPRHITQLPRLGAHRHVISTGDLLDFHTGAHINGPPLQLLIARSIVHGDHEHPLHRPVVAVSEQRLVLHDGVIDVVGAGSHQHRR
uniref:Uncharacterized protein n=1 Tax=Oryza punctata TaxID=4537 RepID=A0A0E0JTD2_ORYPU